MTTNEKCPKCGAEECESPNHMRKYECGSYDGIQSDLCLARCDLATAKKELAELKERHGKLVEAARKVACHINGMDVDFDYFKKTLHDLARVIETEPSNETKPSERGCPFDEALESEAKQ